VPIEILMCRMKWGWMRSRCVEERTHDAPGHPCKRRGGPELGETFCRRGGRRAERSSPFWKQRRLRCWNSAPRQLICCIDVSFSFALKCFMRRISTGLNGCSHSADGIYVKGLSIFVYRQSKSVLVVMVSYQLYFP
jgi:hypothetical protein